MRRDALKMRGAGPTVFAAVKHGDGLDAIIGEIFAAQRRALARRRRSRHALFFLYIVKKRLR